MNRFFDVVKGRENFPSNSEIYKRYIKLAWPAAVEGMFSILISAINLIIIGALGTNSVAAVGIIGQAGMIIQTIARALSVAGTAMIARKYGEQKYDEANDSLRYILKLGLISTVILCAACFIFIDPILIFSGAKQEYMAEAVIYGRSFVISLLFLNVTTILNSGLIAAGKTREMMVSNIAGSIVNMGLTYILTNKVFGLPSLGILGAGLSVIAGNLVSLAITFFYIHTGDSRIRIFGKSSVSDRNRNRQIMSLFYSALSEKLFERVGMFLYSIMVASFGTVDYATHYIVMSLDDIYFCFAEGLSRASTAITGNMMGQGRPDLVIAYNSAGRKVGLVTDMIAFIIYFLLRRQLVALYSSDPAVIDLGENLMYFVACVGFVQTQNLIYAGALRGAGDTKFVAAYSLFDIAIARPIITYLLCFTFGFGVYGAWISMVLDQAIRAVCATIRFRSNHWQNISFL
ncbi:MAG: MATE family efflux transporter [Clostridia bacterium]|nr:MATE family efflux transporter [Clostridia bacterium]